MQTVHYRSFLILFLSFSYPFRLYTAPFFSIQSQSVHAERTLVGSPYMSSMSQGNHCFTTYATITPEYTQTQSSHQIAKSLFGTSCIMIQGSLFPKRDSRSWLADYFGLPQDFDGSIRFHPSIQNYLLDLELFIQSTNLCNGLYLHLHAPLVHTIWKLHPCETSDKGVRSYPAGYFSGNSVSNASLLSYALDFFTGQNIPTNMTNNISVPFGNPSLPATVIFQPLRYSKWATNQTGAHQRITRLSDIEIALGYPLVCSTRYYTSLGVRTSAPTGNKPNGTYLFEPLIGSGGFWKLGIELTAQIKLLQSGDEQEVFSWFLDANLQHLFATCQTRCFDLCSSGTHPQGRNSRYQLAQRLEPVPADNPFPLQPPNSTNVQYASEVAPVANLTARRVTVSIPLEANVATMFRYTHKHITYDIGYALYARSCEKLCLKKDCISTSLDEQTWALKGDSQVFGFTLANDQPVALAATQSDATIYSGVNHFVDNITTRQNSLSIDNPQNSTNAFDLVSSNPQRSSNPVVYLNETDLHMAGTVVRTHALFTHINYAWRSSRPLTPYLGTGFELLYSLLPSETTRSCYVSSYNQWSVWIKAGMFYH